MRLSTTVPDLSTINTPVLINAGAGSNPLAGFDGGNASSQGLDSFDGGSASVVGLDTFNGGSA